jgi:hypothetical protein
MSIVTLKRKTAAKYNNNSVSKPNFSLNGTRRSQGYVGQDTRGRSLPKTIMKGNTPKGYGGCCGKYPINPIVQSAVTSLNNPNIIKPSVVGNYGLIETKYRWIHRPQPFSTTKPDSSFSQLIGTQQQYIEKISKLALNAANKSSCQINKYTPTKCKSTFFKNRNSQINNLTHNCASLTKDIMDHTATPKNGVAMESGVYVKKIHQTCGSLDDLSYPRSVKGCFKADCH